MSTLCTFYIVVYIDVKANTPSSDEIPILKKFIAYNLEQHHRKEPEIMVVALFDMSRAGLGNMVGIGRHSHSMFPLLSVFCGNVVTQHFGNHVRTEVCLHEHQSVTSKSIRPTRIIPTRMMANLASVVVTSNPKIMNKSKDIC